MLKIICIYKYLSGVPRLLEVNPNPGWCWDGHLAKMAGLSNISYPRLLEMILQASEQRISQTKNEESLVSVVKQELIRQVTE